MSRSWERMVQKNTKKTNQIRKKQGQQAIGSASQAKSDFDRFLGRNIILPVTLIAFAVLYALLYTGTTVEQQTSKTIFWVTIGLYILLGIVIFIRRPYLNVGKSFVGTRRFNRDVRVEAAQVKQITVQKGYVVIETKTKGSNWVFSRLTNRYDTAAMGTRLQEFARINNVPIHEK